MHLGRVHLTLNNVEDRDISALLNGGGDEDVFSLKQSSHHIEYSGLSDRGLEDTFVSNATSNSQGCVASHQEVTSGSRDK